MTDHSTPGPAWVQQDITTAAQAAAAEGSAWLDQVQPGWWQEPFDTPGSPGARIGGIVLEELDMAHTCDCVGGQLDGTYRAFADRYQLTMDDAARLGLLAPHALQPYLPEYNTAAWEAWDARTDGEYQALTVAWAAEITRRRQEGRRC
jgi:hypothetical protein